MNEIFSAVRESKDFGGYLGPKAVLRSQNTSAMCSDFCAGSAGEALNISLSRALGLRRLKTRLNFYPVPVLPCLFEAANSGRNF